MSWEPPIPMPGATRSRLLRASLLVFVATRSLALTLELGLRLLPQAVPFALLAEFEPSIRSSIARRRNLQRAEGTTLVPRDDRGPPDDTNRNGVLAAVRRSAAGGTGHG